MILGSIEIEYIGIHKDTLNINPISKSNKVIYPIQLINSNGQFKFVFDIDFPELILNQKITYNLNPLPRMNPTSTLSNKYSIQINNFFYHKGDTLITGYLEYSNDFKETFEFVINFPNFNLNDSKISSDISIWEV